MAIVNETVEQKNKKVKQTFRLLYVVGLLCLIVGVIFIFVNNSSKTSDLAKAKVELNLQKNLSENIKSNIEELKETIEEVAENN